MALFKNTEDRQAAHERREGERAEAAERKRLARRERLLSDLHKDGVLDPDDDGGSRSNEELGRLRFEHVKQEMERRRRELKQRQAVHGLGVMVRADGTVRDPTWGRQLGLLAGAHAEVTSSFQHHRGGAAVSGAVLTTAMGLGPAGALAGFSKKSVAVAVIVFADGTIHQHNLDGAYAIRQAEVGAIAFNAMTQAAAMKDGVPAASSGELQVGALAPESIADEISKLAELHASGVLTNEEFAAAKHQLLGPSGSSGHPADQMADHEYRGRHASVPPQRHPAD